MNPIWYFVIGCSPALLVLSFVLGGPILARWNDYSMGRSAGKWLRDKAEEQRNGRVEFSGSGGVESRHDADRLATGPLPDSFRKEAMNLPERARTREESGAQNFKPRERMTSDQHNASPFGRWTTRPTN